jgi:hypothetical protein
MGWNGSAEKSKNKTKSSEQYAGTETMTPNIHPSLQHPLNKVGHDIGSILDWESRPDGGAWGHDFIAPASALQNQAFSQAGQLGGWRAPMADAMGMARRVEPYSAAQAGAPGLRPMQGYSAPQLGAASQAQAASIGAFDEAQAASSLHGLDAYKNVYARDYVDASLADWDAAAGRQEAAQRARMASIGNAFNNSGVAVADALQQGELARGRNTLGATLRYNALEGAFNRSGEDANRRQAVSIHNSAQSAQRAMAQAQLEQQALLRNADAVDARAVQQGSFDERAGQFGAEAANTGALQEWQGRLGLSQFNAGEQNRVGLQNQQSYLTLLQQMGGLLAGQPFGPTTGQTSSKSGTSSGTRKSTGVTLSAYGGHKGAGE